MVFSKLGVFFGVYWRKMQWCGQDFLGIELKFFFVYFDGWFKNNMVGWLVDICECENVFFIFCEVGFFFFYFLVEMFYIKEEISVIVDNFLFCGKYVN